MVLQPFQVAVHAGLLAQLRAKVAQQRLVRHQRADAGRVGHGPIRREHVVLLIRLGTGGARGLAFALGQHDQRPQHHQQRHRVARQVDVVVAVEARLTKHGVFGRPQQGHGHMVGVDVVHQAHAHLRQAVLHRLPEVGVDQGALDARVLAGQPAPSQQFSRQQGGIVHRSAHVVESFSQTRWPSLIAATWSSLTGETCGDNASCHGWRARSPVMPLSPRA